LSTDSTHVTPPAPSHTHNPQPQPHSFNSIDYKERFIILADLESTSRANVSSDPYLNYTAAGNMADRPVTRLQSGDLEAALKAGLLSSFEGLADGVEDPLHVTVWSTEPDPLFKHLFPDPAPSGAATGEFGTTHRHGVRAYVGWVAEWGVGNGESSCPSCSRDWGATD
jgi:hypothetical protein